MCIFDNNMYALNNLCKLFKGDVAPQRVTYLYSIHPLTRYLKIYVSFIMQDLLPQLRSQWMTTQWLWSDPEDIKYSLYKLMHIQNIWVTSQSGLMRTENVQNGKVHQYFLIRLYQKVRLYTSA
jgi:hypothetical protein